MTLLESIVGFALAILFLVTIHEWAHFVVARYFDVKVLRFSIGFGNPLFRWRVGSDRMEFCLAPIPLGGYVKMLDTRESCVEADELHRAFNNKSCWQRILIVVAGPLMNILTAVLLFAVTEAGEQQTLRPLVGSVQATDLIKEPFLQAGDEILVVNGKKIIGWRGARIALSAAAIKGQKIEIHYSRAGQTYIREIVVDWSRIKMEEVSWDALGVTPFSPPLPPVIGKVIVGSAAQSAGLRASDHIIQINDREIRNWQDMVAVIRASPATEMQFVVLRNHQRFVLPVIIGEKKSGGKTVGFLGAQVKISPELYRPYTVAYENSLPGALKSGVERTVNLAELVVISIVRMIQGRMTLDNISGPITIAQFAGKTVHSGVVSFLHFLAFLSISLGILNLLPIPLLDGGHIVLYIIEWVLGRPLPESVQLQLQRLGLAALGMLMVLALFNDIMRLLTG